MTSYQLHSFANLCSTTFLSMYLQFNMQLEVKFDGTRVVDLPQDQCSCKPGNWTFQPLHCNMNWNHSWILLFWSYFVLFSWLIRDLITIQWRVIPYFNFEQQMTSNFPYKHQWFCLKTYLVRKISVSKKNKCSL